MWTKKAKACQCGAEAANALAINPIMIWPALMFAIKRTMRVKGRMQTLTVSIKTSNGIRGAGAPLGAKWAADFVGYFVHPEIISRPQKTTAILIATQMLLVTP